MTYCHSCWCRSCCRHSCCCCFCRCCSSVRPGGPAPLWRRRERRLTHCLRLMWHRLAAALPLPALNHGGSVQAATRVTRFLCVGNRVQKAACAGRVDDGRQLHTTICSHTTLHHTAPHTRSEVLWSFCISVGCSCCSQEATWCCLTQACATVTR